MGFIRKATFVSTAGMSGLFIKANSKKERQANALEKIAKAAEVIPDTPGEYIETDGIGEGAEFHLSLSSELANLADLHQQGILSDEEFQACKAKLIG